MPPVRIAMWSGPRNISTTMMRSFENRPDCIVMDEPFYAHYLQKTGLAHPMRQEILQAQPTDADDVIEKIGAPHDAPVLFCKLMTHHLTDAVPTAWFERMRHFFLIRDPARMLASYAAKTDDHESVLVSLKREEELFDQVMQLSGEIPPVIDAQDMLANPQAMLTLLCEKLDICFRSEMLHWPSGPRDSDGIWASHWYGSVNTSTGFRAPATMPVPARADFAKLLEACQPHYDRLYSQRLTAG